jgi:hypothetical protein
MGKCFWSPRNHGRDEAEGVRTGRLFAVDVRFEWGYAGCF